MAIAGGGLFLMLWPFLSVWRVSGQVLAELPLVEGTSIDDRRGLSAMWDEDFTLATRIYLDLEPDEVRSAFAGFQSTSFDGEVMLAKECCGEWDAVFVSLDDGREPGSTLASVSVYDTDIQGVYPVIVFLGMMLFIAGLVTWGWRRDDAQPDARLVVTH